MFPYNIQNYAYGLTTIAFWPYTLISALTTLPGIVIYTVMASDLANEGITLRFILQLCLAGTALFILVQLAKLYADTNMWICLLRAATHLLTQK